MTDLFGYRQASPLDLESITEAEKVETENRSRRERQRADTYAHVCHSLGTTVDKMTPNQVLLAERMVQAWENQYSEPRGYGFSIDPTGREPSIK